MDIEEKWDITSSADHQRFLFNFKDSIGEFQDSKCYFTYNDNELSVYKKTNVVEKNKPVVYAICLDGFIMYIGVAKNFYGRCNNYAKGGTKDHIGKKGQFVPGNPTYNRINVELKKLENRISERVKIYFIYEKCNGENDKKKIIDLFKLVFGKKPKWNYKINNEEKKNTKYTKLKYLLSTKEVTENLEKYLKKDREEEIKSNYLYYQSNTRSLEVKQEALKLAQNKCFFEDRFACKSNYFPRKNKIIEENINYLEVHHIIPLALLKSKELHFKNLDIIENTVCLCGNCHNKLHYGQPETVCNMLEILYEKKIEVLKYSELDIGLENLKQIYTKYEW